MAIMVVIAVVNGYLLLYHGCLYCTVYRLYVQLCMFALIHIDLSMLLIFPEISS